MTMVPVESSNIKAIGYDQTTKVLRVEFHKSGTYNFHGIEPEKHAALMASDSKGTHFQRHIRHHHDFQKV
jgi:hypothetical protein